MKEHLRELIRQERNETGRRNLAREYLQARVLEALQEQGAFMRWAFVGGTALRFLYGLPRFSEDLDFSVLHESREPGFREAIRKVKRVLSLEGYDVSVTLNDRKTVFSSFVSFPGLLYELDLSQHREQVFSIKLELDTKPPLGSNSTTTIVRRHVTLNLCHHDKASLMAGKLHAVLSRKWTKGRDLYDLAWYLADPSWPEPNLSFLNAALQQSGWKGSTMTTDSWRLQVLEHLKIHNWKQARDDVLPFLEQTRDLELVSFESLEKLLLQ
ncbi:MAG: nucleotidyl transferase AbiEii/AbiGii toxin family protein [Lentisphaerae bacterium]|nr:nucleotidyl transferase AbiEii/AbiGii toxin family protein [Lentisphaerota bacterium]